MNKAQVAILKRIPKFIIGNVLGTLADTLVLWVFSHFVFSGYVGEVIISPIISFECAVLVNFLVSYHYTWKDRVSPMPADAFLVHWRFPHQAGRADGHPICHQVGCGHL